MKKAGFSLAEVLISLSIIGMVSLLVVPKMVEDANVAKYEAGAKKAFTSLNNVVTYANKNKMFPLQSQDVREIVGSMIGPVIPVSHMNGDYFIGTDGLAYNVNIANTVCGNAPVVAEDINDVPNTPSDINAGGAPCLRVYVNADGQANFTLPEVSSDANGQILKDSVQPVFAFWVYKNGVIAANDHTRAVLTSQYTKHLEEISEPDPNPNPPGPMPLPDPDLEPELDFDPAADPESSQNLSNTNNNITQNHNNMTSISSSISSNTSLSNNQQNRNNMTSTSSSNNQLNSYHKNSSK